VVLVVGALALAGLLYAKPFQAYLHASRQLQQRRAEVRALRREKHVLQQRLAGSAGDAWIVQSARRLGLVQPGQRLFIVKGIAEWERRHGIRPHPETG
jgi:cell division protein FtsB